MHIFMKKIFLSLIAISLGLSTWIMSVFWAEESCWSENGYGNYTCRINSICEQYKPDKPSYETEDYSEAENAVPKFHNQQSNAPALEAAKEIYRDNMGNIYKCSIITAQKNSLTFLKQQLSQESSGELEDTIGGQIDARINRLELSANSINCSLTEQEQILIKLNVLKETTYEACRYINYLEYLKAYYSSTDNVLPSDPNAIKPNYVLGEIPQMMNGIEAEIAEEISHTYKVFPIAYQAYTEYENNFPIHFLLEVIAGDFMILRTRMYESLMPIAQLGLKVINAMSY